MFQTSRPVMLLILMKVSILHFICALSFFPFNDALAFQHDANETASSRKLNIDWGGVFPGLGAKNLNLDATFEGYQICSSALKEKSDSLDYHISDRQFDNLQNRRECQITRKYVPSPYELEHYEKAKEFVEIERTNRKSEKRKRALLDYMTSPKEIEASLRWLARVKVHMKGKAKASRDDFKYLSYFNVTELCISASNRLHSRSWIEWIEPLTVHARHPFSLIHADQDYKARVAAFDYKSLKIPHADIPTFTSVGLINADYVLLTKGRRMDRFTNNGGRIEKNNRYMFDAGTSRFDSSLFWFTCAYQENGIEFDHLYGWEMTLLEPKDFWQKVPPRWKNHYSFFNAPISADPKSNANPLQAMIGMGVKESDFVSFKLDIDSPEFEIPLIVQLNSTEKYWELVDEFFFELHFQCEFLGPCCWGINIPPSVYEAVQMDRPGALKVFSDLRHKGIRAHIWP